MIYIQVLPRDQCWAWVPWMMAVTDIIGFSFFIILAVLIFLFSLVTFTFLFFFFFFFSFPSPPFFYTSPKDPKDPTLKRNTHDILVASSRRETKKTTSRPPYHLLLLLLLLLLLDLLLHLSLLLLLLLLPSLNRANFPSSFGIDLVSFNALLFGCFAFERSTLDRSTIRNKNGFIASVFNIVSRFGPRYRSLSCVRG